MAWILVVGLLVLWAGLAFAFVGRQSALKAEVAAGVALRHERDAAVAAHQVTENQLARAATELDEMRAAAEATAAAAPGGPDARLAALWALAQLEQQRAWRLSTGSDVDGDTGLGPALAMEVERIREDVGTPGSLDARLDQPVAVHDAAFALSAARELLAVLVPHTQAYDMVIEQDGSRLAIEVVCTGWEGPAEAADDVSRLLAAVAPAGGNLSVDTVPDGRLRATLQLPLAES